MDTPDLEILRDIDRGLADLRLELRLHRQEFRYHRRETHTRLKALEDSSTQLPQPLTPTQAVLLDEKILSKIVLFLAMAGAGMAAGKPWAMAVFMALGGKL